MFNSKIIPLNSYLLIFVSILCLVATACDMDKPNDKSLFKYSIEEDNCKTELHRFNTKAAYCEALKNEELNHNCAKAVRELKFRQECPGKWEELINDHPQTVRTAEYVYEIHEINCRTGLHHFSTKGRYCLSLLDEGNNRRCAKSQRLKLFETDCYKVE